MRTSFSNLDCQEKAQFDFRELRMESYFEFFSFAAEFVRLAIIAKVARSEWKRELNCKLSSVLKSQAMTTYINDLYNFNAF